MLTDKTILTSESEEIWDIGEITEVALNILQYRQDTTNPKNKKYLKEISEEIRYLNEWKEDMNFHAGILNEALFYISCKKNLPIDIYPSTGDEDAHGIDFFLGPAKHPIDVTTNPKKYPFKLYDSNRTTLLLPGVSKIEDLFVNTKDFLNIVYDLNMGILNNQLDKYRILVHTEKRSKGGKRKRTTITPKSSRYKSKAPNYEPSSSKKIYMNEQRYENIILILSMLKNFSI